MENTSYISDIAYKVENWKYKGLSDKEIREKIKKLQDDNHFPSNLELADVFYDKTSSTSGCAFYDKNTGETIVGFAGTNLDNGFLESTKDFIADGVGIGAVGIHPTSPYMNGANEFMADLEKAGYNVTTVTGHSLGGCLAVLFALEYNIPLVTTYNAAPVYINPLLLDILTNTIKNYKENYDGRIIQFVSSEDWLNSLSDLFGGTYLGERYMMYNGSGHDRKDFLKGKEQEYINLVLEMEKGILEGKLGFELDFDKDGKPDLSLTVTQLMPKNLLNSPGSVGGTGEVVKVTPETLQNLGFNLVNMNVSDLGWISSAIKECKNKNDQIKANLENRHDTLSNEIVEELKASSLNQLLEGINGSFAKIEKKTDILEVLKNFDSYSVTRKFDEWGGSAGRKWYADGAKWSNGDFLDAVSKLKQSAQVLQHNIETTGEFEYSGSTGKQIYTYDTLSKIGEAFVNVTNGLEPKIKKIFNGSGLREGKQDGISEALAEILQVEENNLQELQNGINTVSQMAHGIGQNFQTMDDWVKGLVDGGSTAVSPQVIQVPSSYNAYLEESHIMDDVNDVLVAFDQQVEERSMELAEALSTDYGDLLSRFNSKCSAIIDYISDFETSISEINNWMSKSITSKYTKTETVNNFMENGKIDIVTPKKTKYTEMTESHGTLSSAFPAGVSEAIADAETSILPLLEVFHQTLAFSEIFTTRVYDFQNYLKTVVEKGVYKSMDLDCIVTAQNGIGQILNKISTELTSLNNQLRQESQGLAMTNFTSQVDDLVILIGYFGQVTEDCFGVKLSVSKPAVGAK